MTMRAGENVYNGFARVDGLSNVQRLKHGMGQIDICIAKSRLGMGMVPMFIGEFAASGRLLEVLACLPLCDFW